MRRILADFDAALTPFAQARSGTSTAAVHADAAKRGAAGLKCTIAANSEYAYAHYNPAALPVGSIAAGKSAWLGFWFNWATSGGTGICSFLEVRGVGGTDEILTTIFYEPLGPGKMSIIAHSDAS
ncbi:MAG TPA: hypothetical protein VM487_00905, partial [Phycisphaerae bacterium]|nr:hypothetical protein [Phycisphaerae bacterium]